MPCRILTDAMCEWTWKLGDCARQQVPTFFWSHPSVLLICFSRHRLLNSFCDLRLSQNMWESKVQAASAAHQACLGLMSSPPKQVNKYCCFLSFLLSFSFSLLFFTPKFPWELGIVRTEIILPNKTMLIRGDIKLPPPDTFVTPQRIFRGTFAFHPFRRGVKAKEIYPCLGFVFLFFIFFHP